MSAHESPLLTETPAGFRVFYAGKELYGSQPILAARLKAQNISLADETLYLVCSPLLWYGIAELAERLSQHSRLVLIEVDPVLQKLVDWQLKTTQLALSKSVVCVSETDPIVITQKITSLISPTLRRVQSISLNGGRLLNAAAYKLIQDMVEVELRRYWRNRSTLLFMGRLWIRNLINNLRNLQNCDDISNFPRQKQLVLCGAGPSLDDSMQWIQENRTNIMLVAVDTALPVLAARGIRTDLVIALEAQMANLQDFVPAWRMVDAIAFDIASTSLVARHCPQAKPWIFSSNFANGDHWRRLMENRIAVTKIPPLGSVGVTALYLCQYLASERIFITGLDFAFSPGMTHAHQSPSHLRFLSNHSRLSGNFGESHSLSEKAHRTAGIRQTNCVSDAILESYRESTNEVIAHLQSRGLEVFDLRNKGLALKMPNWELAEKDWKLMAGQKNGPQVPKIPRVKLQSIQNLTEQLHCDIQNCLNNIQAYVQGNQSSIGETQGRQILQELTQLDFLFYDFPDRDWPNLSPQALVRAMINLDYFRNFIRERFNLPRS